MVFWKSLSKLSRVCLSLRKLVNGKHFPVKEKFGLVCRKVFSFYVGRKTLSSQRKIWLGLQESIFLLFWAKNTFQKL